jgi:predicted transposase/invertase (TIGR01784 family)
VTIELRKLEKDKTLPCHLWDWLVYFKEGWKDAEETRQLALRTKGIAEAEEVCMALARDMSYLEKVRQDMHERDRAIKREDEKRAQEEERRAREEDKKEGIIIGEKRAMRQFARNLKSMGMAVRQIAQASGLSEEEIEKL